MASLSGGLAFWLAERVIEPVKELARRVRSIGPDTPHADLAADFPADELGELAQTFEQRLDRLAAFIERDEERRTPVDLTSLVQETLDKHRHLLQGKAVDVVLDIRAHPALITDPRLLAIVLANLVRNSFTYTERGSVTLRLEGHSLSVSDTGLGIPREAMDRVFQRLYKGPHSQGAGIGLSLVKKNCDRHGWHIKLESEEGRGTVAVLSFAQTPEPDAPGGH